MRPAVLACEGCPFRHRRKSHPHPPMRKAKTCAGNWIPQRKCAKDSADGMIMIDSSVNKNRNRLVLEDIETRLAGVQSKSFHTETNIATEKIFDVASAAPRVIPTNIMVVSAKHGAAFTGTLRSEER